MVSKKSVCYGRFDGIKPPVIPKAPRTLRVELDRKSSEGSKLCAFELLADVAEKLLHESEISTSSIGHEQKELNTVPIVKQEAHEVKVKHVDQGSCVESSIPVPSNLKRKLDSPLKDSPESENDSGLEHVSDVKTYDFMKKIESNVKLEPVEEQNVELAFKDSRLDNCVLNKADCSSVGINVKTGITEDDDNSIRFNQHDTKIRAFRSQSRVGYRRIRKMLTSRYRKVPAVYELTNPTDGVKSRYQNRKNLYKRERYQLEAASKRRKLFHHSSKIEKNGNNNKSHPRAASKKVKFSINSFKVPELYVEIPENATIGSLKRSVMDAVKAILGGELHVGILLEGKKVRDNNQTLQQTGISHNNSDLETLGFTLEPSFSQDAPTSIQKELPLSLASPITDVGYSNSCLDLHPATSLGNHVDKKQEIIPLQTQVLTEERVADTKTLAPVAAVKTEELSDIPVNNRNLAKKYEISQRRIRRPFSVSEVEALVEAVETHGPGRWREVKLCAFDDADHRTYVDLKDKWKTLVHTASISPLQRRGAPVPQHLLDRVLAVHEFWSNNQTKQSQKQQSEPLRIMGSC